MFEVQEPEGPYYGGGDGKRHTLKDARTLDKEEGKDALAALKNRKALDDEDDIYIDWYQPIGQSLPPQFPKFPVVPDLYSIISGVLKRGPSNVRFHNVFGWSQNIMFELFHDHMKKYPYDIIYHNTTINEEIIYTDSKYSYLNYIKFPAIEFDFKTKIPDYDASTMAIRRGGTKPVDSLQAEIQTKRETGILSVQYLTEREIPPSPEEPEEEAGDGMEIEWKEMIVPEEVLVNVRLSFPIHFSPEFISIVQKVKMKACVSSRLAAAAGCHELLLSDIMRTMHIGSASAYVRTSFANWLFGCLID